MSDTSQEPTNARADTVTTASGANPWSTVSSPRAPSLGIPTLAELRLAAGFLTILPVMPQSSAELDAVARSFGWFPLVGFVVGGVLAVENAGLSAVFGTLLASAMTIATLCVLSGAMHLDAIADTADAIGAGTDRGRALEIMRDSRVGSFATTAIVFLLLLETLALARADRSGVGRAMTALWLAPGLARWAMVAVSWRMEYLRVEGAGAALVRASGARNLTLGTVIVALAVLPVLSLRTLAACAVAAILAVALRAGYRRWLGGVTGDLIGAAGQIVELAVLLAMAVR